MKARQINDTIRYTMWSVFQQHAPLAGAPEQGAPEELAQSAPPDQLVAESRDEIGVPHLVLRQPAAPPL